MNSPSNPTPPYSSARDLPTVVELEQQVLEFEALASLGFAPPEARKQLADAKAQLDQLVSTIDAFCNLLGPRNWVFTEDLNPKDIERIIDSATPTEAERRLIDYYKLGGRLKTQIQFLRKIPAMAPRIDLLEKALIDYQAKRYYSTVLVLLAVMDGFVNDVDKQLRKNLNSRDAAEMVPWDSVAGHHLGLGHAHATFNSSTRKTVTSETTELLRNGIMHGMIVDFDNDTVATKAWNRLFAVVDWAKSRDRKALPPKRETTWAEVTEQFRVHDERTRHLARWKAHSHTFPSDDRARTDIDNACLDFLQTWENKQWGLVGKHFYVTNGPAPSTARQAVLAKNLFERHELECWTIGQIHHKGASMAEVHAKMTINKKRYTARMKWLYSDGEGNTLFDWQTDGAWQLSPYGPTTFLTETT